MKKIFTIAFSLLIFSGCSFFNDTKKEVAPTYIELEGTLIDENNSNFGLSEYFLLNAEQEKVAALNSQKENLDRFVDKKVVLKGEKKETPEKILTLDVVQISALPEEDITVSSDELGFSLLLPSEFSGTEKNHRFHVLKKKTEDQFFTVFLQNNEEWKAKFLATGEKIILKDFDVRRIYSGKRIQLYFPKEELQIDYWGEKNGEYDFYQILESLQFFEKKAPLSTDKEKTKKIEIAQNSPSTAEITREDSKKSLDIVEKIEAEIQKISENSDQKIKKIALYKDYADVEISEKNNADEITKTRIVYKISGNDSPDIQLKEVARFKEGEIQSWDLESGEIPALKGASEIFLRDIDDVQPISLPENFALYISTHFDFQVGYPRNMYYGASGKSETSLASVNWSSSPLTPENSEIRLEIKKGFVTEEKIIRDENTIIFPRDEKTHFKFSALHDNFDIVEKMKKNFRNEQ